MQRVRREEDGVASLLVYDAQKLIAEAGAGVSGGVERYYLAEGGSVYSPLVSQLGSQHWFLFDALGTTLGLAGDAGSLSDTFLYDALGNHLAVGAAITPMQYASRVGWYWEARTGMYLAGQPYAPATGQPLAAPSAPELSGGAGDGPVVRFLRPEPETGPPPLGPVPPDNPPLIWPVPRPYQVAWWRWAWPPIGPPRTRWGFSWAVALLWCSPLAGPEDDQLQHPCFKMKHDSPTGSLVKGDEWTGNCKACCEYLYHEDKLKLRELVGCNSACNIGINPYDPGPHGGRWA